MRVCVLRSSSSLVRSRACSFITRSSWGARRGARRRGGGERQYTVEPQDNGHSGDRSLVHCREVVAEDTVL